MPLKKRPDGKYDTGRPLSITDEVIQKLHDAFCFGASDTEACSYAEIAPQTLYNYQKEHADFIEWKEQLKKKPILKAKGVIYNALENGDKDTAKWYLERKAKDEFGTRTEITGADGESLTPPVINILPIKAKDEE